MRVAQFIHTIPGVTNGTARSVATFAKGLRLLGQEVAIVYSESELDDFTPDIIHAHHPFHAGMAALRLASTRGVPLVLTHHTLYGRESDKSYLPGLDRAEKTASDLALAYSRACDFVVAPTPSVEKILRHRGVGTDIVVIPSGIDVSRFEQADGLAFRLRHQIPADAFVAGHLGRLVPEKRIHYLAEAIALFLQKSQRAHALICGVGPETPTLVERFYTAQVADRLHLFGHLPEANLRDAYAAMDVFAFASLSDTQGIVLLEAMASGVPVLAHQVTGPCDLVVDGENGQLLPSGAGPETFAEALWNFSQTPDRETFSRSARHRAAEYDDKICAERMLAAYKKILSHPNASHNRHIDEIEVLHQKFLRAIQQPGLPRELLISRGYFS